MGEAYRIKDQDTLYFFTFQVVGWADGSKCRKLSVQQCRNCADVAFLTEVDRI